jgi:hypothetical protein
MINVPGMIMIGGNSRNSGKTSIACNIISKLSATQEVIGLKVTSIRPGEEDLHGNHNLELNDNYTIFEELNAESQKDTSKMLKAGATRVYYIRVDENFTKQAILHFLATYVNNQLIVCESRSLRRIITPGLFVMMLKLPVVGKEKEISEYLNLADKTFFFGENMEGIKQFYTKINFKNGIFVWCE